MKKCLLYIVSLLMFSGCSTTNYHKVNSLKKDFNILNPNDIIIISNKGYNPSKDIFKSLKGELSNDFIYIFGWVNHLPVVGTNDFTALVYDYTNKRVFYASYEQHRKLVIEQESRHDVGRFREGEFILRHYLRGVIEFLTSVKRAFASAEIGSEYYVFDSKSDKVFLLKNIVLDENGNLYN